MAIVRALLFILTVIFNSIDLGLQFDHLPNGEPIPNVPRGEFPPSSPDRILSSDRPFSSAKPYFPDRSLPPARSISPARSLPSARPSPARTPRRIRSKSPATRIIVPPTKIDSSAGPEYDLKHLELIRLTSFRNKPRMFKLRRYTFPPEAPIRLLAKVNLYSPMPTEEQIVLSTADGYAFAILETSYSFAGMYAAHVRYGGRARAKINMKSGKISPLTKDEVIEVPVGRNNKIIINFNVELINHNPRHQ